MMKTEIAFDNIKINSHHIDDNDKIWQFLTLDSS